MTLNEIRSLVLRVLQDVQAMSGREWGGLGAGARPIGNLDGFDSLSGIEATVMIEEALRCKLDIESVFVSGDGKRALTVDGVSERLKNLLAAYREPK